MCATYSLSAFRENITDRLDFDGYIAEPTFDCQTVSLRSTPGAPLSRKPNPPSKFHAQLGLGGCCCLDFANTVTGRTSTEYQDGLASYDDILEWASVTGMLDGNILRKLSAKAKSVPDMARRGHRRARRFRDAIYDVFSAIAAGDEPARAAMDRLNSKTFRILSQTEFRRSRDRYTRQWTAADDALERILWPVAWSVFELLNSDEVLLVRECANPECHWLFIDRSPNRRRRWCDMRQCGNVMKARRHYRRRKKI